MLVRPTSWMMLCMLFLLLHSNIYYVSADEEGVLTSLTSGFDLVSSTLNDHNNGCAKKILSEKLEEKVSSVEGFIERQWEQVIKTKEKVENATARVQEMMNHYNSHSPTTAPDVCSEPFKRVAGSCFWMHKSPGLNWEDSRRKCQQSGADLATPDQIEDVMTFLHQELGRGWIYVWLGAKRRSGSWKWLDTDRSMVLDSSQWFISSFAQGECAAFNGGKSYKVMEWDCEDTNWFLCEKKI